MLATIFIRLHCLCRGTFSVLRPLTGVRRGNLDRYRQKGVQNAVSKLHTYKRQIVTSKVLYVHNCSSSVVRLPRSTEYMLFLCRKCNIWRKPKIHKNRQLGTLVSRGHIITPIRRSVTISIPVLGFFFPRHTCRKPWAL